MDISNLSDWSALRALVFLFGRKHGFDADHLATVDGLTRFNGRAQPHLARYCGSLFSLGHGSVVVAIALSVSAASRMLRVPHWIEGVGALISISFLVLLGVANLRAVLNARPHDMVAPIGFKGRWFGRLSQVSSPWLIVLVGALFATSFDTLSQAALFAVVAGRFGGWEHALVLGLLFMSGMLVVDGLNGLWVSRLLNRADRFALIGSRVMRLVLAAISLLVAGLATARWIFPLLSDWSEGREIWLGGMVVAIVGCGFLAAPLLNQRVRASAH